MLFIAWGKLGNLIGGIDLFHMRLLHALVGLLAVAACYALFRQLLPRNWAFLGDLARRHQSLDVHDQPARHAREHGGAGARRGARPVALGLPRAHELAIFLGGVVAGFGFYVYYPARIAFPIWVAFLIVIGILYRKRSRRQL